MSSAHVTKISHIKNVTHSEAREFCLQVQKCFRVGVPPFKEIAKTVELLPDACPRNVALSISPQLSFPPQLKPPKRKGKKGKTTLIPMSPDRKYMSLRPKQHLTHPWLSDKKLIKSIANLIPDDERGNEEEARNILTDIIRDMPKVTQRLTSEQVLKVFKRVKRSGNWSFQQLKLEARKEIYGHSGNPDNIRIIYVPMGGKPK